MTERPGESNSRGLRSVLKWMSLLAGGLAAVWLATQESRRRGRGDAGASAGSVHRLCNAIIGNDKPTIAAVFGPPRASAGFAALAPALLVASDYLHADIWYYPLDRIARAALVVQFDQGIARHAQLVESPK